MRSSQGEQCQKPYTSPGRQHPLLLPHPSGWSWLYRCPTSLPLGNPAGLAFLPNFLFTACDAVLLEEVIPEYSPSFFCSFPPLPSQPPPLPLHTHTAASTATLPPVRPSRVTSAALVFSEAQRGGNSCSDGRASCSGCSPRQFRRFTFSAELLLLPTLPLFYCTKPLGNEAQCLWCV